MLILERPWTRQPTSAVGVYPNRALSDGLTFAYLPSTNADELRRQAYAAVGTPIRPAASGIAIAGDGSTANYVKHVTSAENLVGNTSAIVLLTLGTTTGTRVLFDLADSTANRLGSLSINDGAAGRISFYRSIGTRDQASGTVANVVAENETCLVGISVGPNIRSIPAMYKNGVAYSASAWYGPNNADGEMTQTNPSTKYLGANFAAGQLLNGKIYLVAFWNRLLSAAEHAALALNPWRLFAPRRIYIPTAAAAATAPTITALSAINITATSAQPRISYS